MVLLLGRSLPDLAMLLRDLHAAGCDLYLHQQGIDTTTAAGRAMFQMMGVFAELERALIQERVKAGMARAKAQGKHVGRPKLAPKLAQAIRDALAVPGRPGIRVLAKHFGVSPMTVQRCGTLTPLAR